jgi:AcrR family transcriptional regulator
MSMPSTPRSPAIRSGPRRAKTAAVPMRRRREPRIQAIVAAAADVFLEKGFHAGSLDDVARRANASKATIYAHFGSKVGLFQAIITTMVRDVFEPVRQGELSHAPAATVLTGLGTAFLTRMLSPPIIKFYRLMVSQGSQFPELAQMWFTNGPKTVIGTLAGFLKERTAAGELDVDEPELAAEFFVMSLRGVLQLQAVTGLAKPPFDKAIRAKVSGAVNMFMRAYAAAAPKRR